MSEPTLLLVAIYVLTYRYFSRISPNGAATSRVQGICFTPKEVGG